MVVLAVVSIRPRQGGEVGEFDVRLVVYDGTDGRRLQERVFERVKLLEVSNLTVRYQSGVPGEEATVLMLEGEGLTASLDGSVLRVSGGGRGRCSPGREGREV